MTKHCKVPGCKKELPERYKLPLCDYHRGICKERGEKAGKAAVVAGAGVALFVKRNGLEAIKKAGAQVAKIVSAVAKKL